MLIFHVLTIRQRRYLFPTAARDLSIRQNVQSCSEPHLPSYLKGTAASFTFTAHSLATGAELKICEATPHFHINLGDFQRGNFTFLRRLYVTSLLWQSGI